MKTLYSSATSSRDKDMLVFPNGKHNDTWMVGGAEYLAKLKQFLAKYAQKGSAHSAHDQAASATVKKAAL